MTDLGSGSVYETEEALENAALTEPTEASSEVTSSIDEIKYLTENATSIEPAKAREVNVSVRDPKDLKGVITTEPTNAYKEMDSARYSMKDGTSAEEKKTSETKVPEVTGSGNTDDSTKTVTTTERTTPVAGRVNETHDSAENITTTEQQEAPGATSTVNDIGVFTKNTTTTTDQREAYEVTGCVNDTRDSTKELTTTQQPNVVKGKVSSGGGNLSDKYEPTEKETATISPKHYQVNGLDFDKIFPFTCTNWFSVLT